MNFKGPIVRDGNLDRAFEELDAELGDAFDESVNFDDLFPPKNHIAPEEVFAAENNGPQAEDRADSPEATRRLTAHTQRRLTALSSFDGLFNDARSYLDEINERLSEVTTTHSLTREFFSILHADIHRANELEQTNVSLTVEKRVLSEQLHEAARKQREQESAVEALQHRETSLAQEKEALRSALAAIRLELVEAANTNAKNEAELGDVVKALSARAIEADRRLRENETLREKQVGLSIELDKALKREAETRRRLDELSTIHANETAQHSELLGALGRSGREEVQLQKLLEIAQTRLSETTEAVRLMEGDREAEIARNLAEVRGLRSEIENVQSRLERASAESSEALSEVARLKVQLSDAVAEKQVADGRLSALMKENESDKMNLSTVSANLSQLSVQQASEQIQFDIQRQECEDLRAEIASLNARITELLPYERLHRVTKARLRDSSLRDSSMVEVPGAVAESARATSRRRVRASLRAPRPS